MAELVSTGMPANDSKVAERGTERSAALTPILQAEQYQRPDALGDQGCEIHALARQKQCTCPAPARSELTRLHNQTPQRDSCRLKHERLPEQMSTS